MNATRFERSYPQAEISNWLLTASRPKVPKLINLSWDAAIFYLKIYVKRLMNFEKINLEQHDNSIFIILSVKNY